MNCQLRNSKSHWYVHHSISALIETVKECPVYFVNKLKYECKGHSIPRPDSRFDHFVSSLTITKNVRYKITKKSKSFSMTPLCNATKHF